MNANLNVLITIPFPEKLLQTLQVVSSRLQITVRQAHTADDIPADLWRAVDVLYSGGMVPTLEQAPNLKWVQFHFAGIDRVAESPIFKTGVLATTLSGVHAPQMGEYVLMMLLALSHRLPDMLALNEWPRERFLHLMPTELRGSTVGMVGYGSITREVARLLQPFDVNVLAAKWNVMEVQDQGYTLPGLGDPAGDFPRRIYPFQALKSMLRECDYLVVAVPLTEAPAA